MTASMMSVGGLTLVSRVAGFFRDIVLAAVLGAGPVADAFFVALRLPNHFRAIFAEGAFNAAFVPAYARVREQSVSVWALIGHARAVRGDSARVARDYELPQEAVEAASSFYRRHKAIIDDRLAANVA